MEQLADVVPMVQILDIPVPQMEDQLVATLKHLDQPIPEQVVEVPKIASSSRSSRMRRSRMVHLEPQTAERLAEVPTVVSFSSLQQQTAEHIIDTPVPRHSRGRGGGLQGFSPEQNSTAPVSQQIVDIPVRSGGLQGFRQDRFLHLYSQALALRMRRWKVVFFSHFSPKE